MSENFARYHCQMALPGFGATAQRRLQNARVLIVGAGGLGCPAAQYLAASGVGTIGIADDDNVAESNLHRQILFTQQDIGKNKAERAAQKLKLQNQLVRIVPYQHRVDQQNVMALIADYDLIVDGTDNFDAKYLLSDACVLSHKPLVYGAIYQHEGQMAVLNVLLADGTYSPSYRDIFPRASSADIPNCAEGGVMPPLAGMIGCMQASEVIKYFTDREALLTGKLSMLNIQTGNLYQVELQKDPSVSITELPHSVALIDLEALNEQDFQLMDVRSGAEHEMFNIGGVNIPFNELPGMLHTLSKDKPIVCYCASGKRSIEAAKLIRQHFPKVVVYSLRNGVGLLMPPDLLKPSD
ncbi:HesA/MoeB/ThiF family protein [Arachidicoccus terrestris]|uniref:HesA/MoeB/ThiF family protein n=1 Tax=Arachidicoccus terrestris TaxID=2875539 RepID=UPI001CC383B7|nr:HesA/MoeB/ThiF family protein [Arachidicoccus terrestris]UAY56697.1 HesA/MoeB/ThiF family protein [Arachidicoccus terrestris]